MDASRRRCARSCAPPPPGKVPTPPSTSPTDEPGIPPVHLLEVGRVIRPHGLRGEVVVALVTNRLERLAPGSVLTTGPPSRAGQLEVVSSRPHQRRHLVRFAGVDDIGAAEALRDVVLSAPAMSDPAALFVHELIGAEVFERDGVARGRVSAVEANPASDLLVVDGRHLVPLRFVVEHTPGRLVVEVPTGLFET